MRLKRLLVVLLPLLIFSVGASASAPELINVSVVGQGQTTTVTLHASGAFTHNEYRPENNLLYVDMIGISTGKLDGSTHAVDAPGVRSYEVAGYAGSGGVQVTRVKLTLAEHSDVRVNSTGDGLIIEVVPPAASASSAAPVMPSPAAADTSSMPVVRAAADIQSKPALMPPPTSATGLETSKIVPVSNTSSKPVEVRNVAVLRTANGVVVEVSATGPLTPRTMRLTSPDRIVLDLPGAVPAGRPRTVNVGADGVTAVRLGRFQAEPPITRVVVDLAAASDFDIEQENNKLSLTVRPANSSPMHGVVAAPGSGSQPVAEPSTVQPNAAETRTLVSKADSDPAGPNTPQQKAELVSGAEMTLAQASPQPAALSAPAINTAPPISAELKPAVLTSAQPVAVSDPPTSPASTSETSPASTEPAAGNQPASASQPSANSTPASTEPAAGNQPASASQPSANSTPASTEPAVVSQPASASQPSANSTPVSTGPAASNQPATPSQPSANSTPASTNDSQAGSKDTKDFVVVEPKFSDKNKDQESATTASANTDQPANPPAGKAESAQQQPPVNLAAEQRKRGEAQPEKPRYTGEPISVNLKDVDLKDFFRLIHEISGLNIVLDPAVSGSLTLVLDDVPWDQALDIVLRNNGLDRQLEGNVLRIATLDTLRKEAAARTAQRDAQILAADPITVTRFLSYAHAKDMLLTLKPLLTRRGQVVADERTNSVIITDVPIAFPRIDTLLKELDRKTPQVEIDARVVAATRSFSRDIGTQLGLGWGNQSGSTTVGGSSAVGSTPTQVGYINPPAYQTVPGIPYSTSGNTSATAASIPLFSNLGVTSPTSGLSLINLGSAYRVDAILTMAESRGLAKILSRPRIITQNNQKAVVKQGQQIPIETASTAFTAPSITYINAELRLTVTPQITADNTIFMNVDIENTTADFSTSINGNPVLDTEEATTQVLVKNGGTVVIGGVLQAQNSVTINQVPFIGSIPILGNLFKNRSVSTQTTELIFFLMPRIVES